MFLDLDLTVLEFFKVNKINKRKNKQIWVKFFTHSISTKKSLNLTIVQHVEISNFLITNAAKKFSNLLLLN